MPLHRFVSFVGHATLAASMLLAALAGLLLLAAIEASSGLPVELLPEVVIVRQVAQTDACVPAHAPGDRAAPVRQVYEAIADVRCADQIGSEHAAANPLPG
jgi:hypothetical protein